MENEVTKIDKNREKNFKKISYILPFIDNARFMASSISNLVNNLSEGIHRINCKYGRDKCEACKIKYNYYDCFFKYKSFKDDLI